MTVGVLDQTSRAYEPRYDALATDYRSDGDFVHAVESRVPRGSMIFQLPYVEFPEAPALQGMADYDLLRGYLHSRDLRWSYGRIKGRGEDRAATIAAEKVPDLVRDAKASGFAGIYVDRFGYSDGAAKLEQQLASETGGAPLVSPNARALVLPAHRLIGTRPCAWHQDVSAWA